MLVDWLPWNHTFGGNHNFGIVLYNGGTLYIDDGKPTPARSARRCATCARSRRRSTSTCPRASRRSRRISKPTRLARRTSSPREDVLLRRRRRWRSRSGTSCSAWPSARSASASCFLTGLGMTETAPFAICAHLRIAVQPGNIGLPAPRRGAQAGADGRQDRSAATGARTSRRATGGARAHRRSLRREGFYRTGDALKFDGPSRSRRACCSTAASPRTSSSRPAPSSSVGPLRAKIIDHGAPLRAGRGDRRPEPRRNRRADFPDSRPAASLRPGRRRAARRGAGRRRSARRLPDAASTRSRASSTGSATRVAALHPDARAAVDRQGRGHRQGLDQPARRADPPRRAGRGALRRRRHPANVIAIDERK